MVTLLSLEHPENAAEPMVLTLLGMLSEVMEEHPENELDRSWVTGVPEILEGIDKEP